MWYAQGADRDQAVWAHTETVNAWWDSYVRTLAFLVFLCGVHLAPAHLAVQNGREFATNE